MINARENLFLSLEISIVHLMKVVAFVGIITSGKFCFDLWLNVCVYWALLFASYLWAILQRRRLDQVRNYLGRKTKVKSGASEPKCSHG